MAFEFKDAIFCVCLFCQVVQKHYTGEVGM